MKKQATAEMLFSAAVVGIGVFFFTQAVRIERYYDDLVGAAFLPYVITCSIIFLGLISTIKQLIRIRKLESSWHNISISVSFFTVVVPFATLTFIYVGLFILLGYFLSTFIMTILALVLYKNRGMIRLIVTSLISSVILYLIFVKVIGIYDPPGILF